MGEVEIRGRIRKRKRDIKFALLAAVKVAAITGFVLAAPNAVQSLYKLGLLERSPQDSSTINRARKRLIASGHIRSTEKGLRLTDRGRKELDLHEALMRGDVPRRWDGRWRVLIFDIPEHRKADRDKIRRTLRHIGFLMLQDSVWVFPYDVEDFVSLVKADLHIGRAVRYMIVDEIEGDEDLRKHFGLKGK